MAIRSISKMGHPVLREKTRLMTAGEITSPDGRRLVADMVDTMRDADGVGLAAPQIYEGVRLISVEVRSQNHEDEEPSVPLLVLANPEIVDASEEMANGWEGCLSIPDIRGIVPRHARIVVEGLNPKGRPVTLEAEGFAARILQHEIDHLDGVLFLDRMEDLRTLTYLREFDRFWLHPDGVAEE